jgi:hypothetical protein
MGSTSLFGHRYDRFLHRLSDSAPLLLHPTLLHLPGLRVCCSDIAVSVDGAYPILYTSTIFGATQNMPGSFQCKHALATLIAERLAKCVVREMGKDEFVALLARQIPDT